MSYLGLRKGIGIIGVALPIVLIFGRILVESLVMMKWPSLGILDSVSNYYYSVMRDVFVGSLCATGVFLFCYRYERWGWDDILGDVAGISAIGVALFPTTPPRTPNVVVTELQMIIGTVHLLLAGCFLLTLAIFALWLFRKKDPNKAPTDKKLLRNNVYACCGVAILFFLVLIVLDVFLPGPLWLQSIHPLFWLETFSVWAFGVAWFVKGEGFLPLNDKKIAQVVTSKNVMPLLLDDLGQGGEAL
jgi:hypothetical protein